METNEVVLERFISKNCNLSVLRSSNRAHNDNRLSFSNLTNIGSCPLPFLMDCQNRHVFFMWPLKVSCSGFRVCSLHHQSIHVTVTQTIRDRFRCNFALAPIDFIKHWRCSRITLNAPLEKTCCLTPRVLFQVTFTNSLLTITLHSYLATTFRCLPPTNHPTPP